MAVVPAADAGGRPAANAATHSSAKTSVHVDTVFNFTPRTGFSSVGAGAIATAFAIARVLRCVRFLRDRTFDIPVLLYSGALSRESCICGDRQDRAAGVSGREPRRYFLRKFSIRAAISLR